MIKIELLSVFLPLVGSILSSIINHRMCAQLCATMFVIFSSLLSWYLFFNFQDSYIIDLFPWIQVYDLEIHWSLYIDTLSIIMLVIVNTVSVVVHLYSIGYMSHDMGASRFLSYLSLFTFFMLMLITSGNFLQLFLGWEGVGLCSYLLIGFWFEKSSANKAAMKAFIVNRVGDFFFILGIIAVFLVFESLDFTAVFHNVANPNHIVGVVNFFGYQMPYIDIVCLLLFIGCMGKSAQIGLHTWLPDAMEGPTPASALIHAATMVTAGVFLVARCSPLFELSDIARNFILIIGTITCLFAATIAIAQTDLKKVIAYSTCSQLGYMFIACGLSAYSVAIFHLMTHAFFKALLFLCAGNIIHSTHEQDIFKIRASWRQIPFTYILTWIGSLALAGIFPFAGFYSKDLIIESSYQVSNVAFVISNLVAFLTAFYSWRLIIIVFHGNDSEKMSIHESGKLMLLPLLVLTIGSVFSGVWGEKILLISDPTFWKNSIKVQLHDKEVGLFIKLLPLFLSILGIVCAYLRYYFNNFTFFRFDKLVKFLYKKWYIDELYYYIFIVPVKFIANFFSQVVDKKIIDYFGLGGITKMVDSLSKGSVKIQTGFIFDYAFVMLLGLISIVMWLIYNNTGF
ncbi:NADH-quinone oxidoreductase subunit L [Ehrlichia ruminantium]|uniref:NADH-quinone oxidoreductase subunit L n=1 Tax=Ehrlichia ruminantium TaxID=779 RepID=A0AAE6Q921_EHRRU|nr:NADH-quinone oxidoreductase subunit L [Ehrlichia ruminantium]QGR02546.1 NADH-quinone oxidoreductase subunit L [Ehrlichia ruminantium]QGR03467.1 NADH-quinone oxidoreductase subunit L [Ehrlichia ruminantium]QGR04392.1 NADH-quinone oxidoreductase subunit L [Ehrlichia ruminantium]